MASRVDLLHRAEMRRANSLTQLDAVDRANRGQYFTPVLAAQIMAQMFRVPESSTIKILDPGAGAGILSVALVQRLRQQRSDLDIQLTVIENDFALHPFLAESLHDLKSEEGVDVELIGDDFLSWAISTDRKFDLIIQNPPYSKLRSESPQQRMLRNAGVVVPNMYAAFMELGVRLLVDGGQQVSITPRSWMNGTYYSHFRKILLSEAGINAIHTFESRSKVFGDTGVLQEAIIVSLTRNNFPDIVRISTSHDHTSTSTTRRVAYTDIVTPGFIHVPATEHDTQAVSWMNDRVFYGLSELGLDVSTGKVVDFRSREMLHYECLDGAVPMVNPNHVKGGSVKHPIGTKKPEWFLSKTISSEKLLIPAGTYVLIKRFSAKEERRRIIAALWSSRAPAAFDNKLNYVHKNGSGLELEVAKGLVVFLNSTQLDDYFRVFSGHTQVNATDLRQIKFPSLAQLRELGSMQISGQPKIDTAVEAALAPVEVFE